jgi:hypothetical protein
MTKRAAWHISSRHGLLGTIAKLDRAVPAYGLR